MIELHLLRHAKTERNSVSGKDFDRKLAKKGFRQLQNLKEHIENHAIHPDVILVSSAKRTRETYNAMQTYFSTPVHFLEDLYLASHHEILSILADFNEAKSILVIGHNNGISDLATYLTEQDCQLPTCGYVQIAIHLTNFNQLSMSTGIISHQFFPSGD
jgi:phosphohistidine phosphatase